LSGGGACAARIYPFVEVDGRESTVFLTGPRRGRGSPRTAGRPFRHNHLRLLGLSRMSPEVPSSDPPTPAARPRPPPPVDGQAVSTPLDRVPRKSRTRGGHLAGSSGCVWAGGATLRDCKPPRLRLATQCRPRELQKGGCWCSLDPEDGRQRAPRAVRGSVEPARGLFITSP